MFPWEIKKFEVFTSSLYDGYICDSLFKPDINQIKDIIDQLFSGLGQIIRANKCHNDLKPTNILYRYRIQKYEIKIGDFGQCGTKGGTPGWTAPVFLEDRKPGKEDIYSLGLVILRLLCDNTNLFHCLRDNFVENTDMTEQWMIDFKDMTEIKFVLKMMDLDNQPTFDQIKNEWNQIKSSILKSFKLKSGIQMIDGPRLLRLSVPLHYLDKPQYNHTE